MTWWPAWEGQAKGVCQWVHSRARRELLQSRLQGCSIGVFESFTAGCERFADWRWKTLGNVTRDLSRMQDALRLATATLRTSDFASRDSVHVQVFLTAVQSDTFWRQSSALDTIVKPVTAFSSWVRGCPCHEAECFARATSAARGRDAEPASSRSERVCSWTSWSRCGADTHLTSVLTCMMHARAC